MYFMFAFIAIEVVSVLSLLELFRWCLFLRRLEAKHVVSRSCRNVRQLHVEPGSAIACFVCSSRASFSLLFLGISQGNNARLRLAAVQASNAVRSHPVCFLQCGNFGEAAPDLFEFDN